MLETIERLLDGDQKIVNYFVRAGNKWEEFFDEVEDNVKDMSNRLGTLQFWFEQNCGGRRIGQEIMVWSGFGYLYDTGPGFEDNWEKAKRLKSALGRSSVSVEVKVELEDVVHSYGLER